MSNFQNPKVPPTGVASTTRRPPGRDRVDVEGGLRQLRRGGAWHAVTDELPRAPGRASLKEHYQEMMNAGIGRMSALRTNRTRRDGGNDVNDQLRHRPEPYSSRP